MRLPRDLSADEFVKAFGQFGYQITRQKGSPMRLTMQRGGEHHLTIPRHDPLRVELFGGFLIKLRLIWL